MTPRKWLTLGSIIGFLAFIGLSLCPFYRVEVFDPNGVDVRSVYTGSFFEAIWIQYDPKNVVRVIIYSICGVAGLVGLFFLIRSILIPKDDLGDKEDKFYVFGMFFIILCCTLKGMGDFGFNHVYEVFVSLGFALLGILAVVFHHKKVVDY